MDRPDYLIVGTGLSALTFGALMAKAGRKVQMLEAHEYPGGYGHTFPMGEDYRFNAQLHYVWNCGPGQPVTRVLEKLSLEDEVTFQSYNPDGFDRMRIPGYALDIPYDYGLLGDRLTELFPQHSDRFRRFLKTVQTIGEGIKQFDGLGNVPQLLRHAKSIGTLTRYHRLTLQELFDTFDLPLEAQSLLASQWPDFLLPPKELSVVSWVGLFNGYMNGAFYPTKHFEHVVKSLERVILENGGQIDYETRVTGFLMPNGRVEGVVAEPASGNGERSEYRARTTICNMDPQRAAEIIGFNRFPRRTQRLLRYDYSHSNFMAYCVVEGIDLEALNFKGSNLFHSEDVDINRVYYRMYDEGNYRDPAFAVTAPTLLTREPGACGENQHVLEFLTAANYQRFLDLKISSRRRYNAKKQEILDRMLDLTEEHYIPNLREHLVFKTAGTPTTSERFCNAPRGNSYGSNMTPRNMGLFRLKHHSSLDGLYFCNASSGYPGFAGTISTGARLYENLTGDPVIRGRTP